MDIDGTLAPIVRHAADAHVPQATRTLLIEIARRYRIVGCVSGRPATGARQMVAIGTIAYVGNHGGELLRPGATRGRGRPRSWSSGRPACGSSPRRCTGPSTSGCACATRTRARSPPSTGGGPPTRRAPRPPSGRSPRAPSARAWRSTGAARCSRCVRRCCSTRASGSPPCWRRAVAAALYVGDDTTDLDAFRGLRELVSSGGLEHALCVGGQLRRSARGARPRGGPDGGRHQRGCGSCSRRCCSSSARALRRLPQDDGAVERRRRHGPGGHLGARLGRRARARIRSWSWSTSAGG